MKLHFKDIIDRHKGKPAIVLGHGPSLVPYISRQQELADKGVVRIGCNEWYYFYDVPPDYWTLSNTHGTIEREIERMKPLAGKSTICYADNLDTTDADWVRDNIQCDYLPYDQRHRDGVPCNFCPGRCCVVPGRKTIQQEVQAHTGADSIYMGGDTVALHCISMGILLGCNPIHVAGCEFDYHLGYAPNSNKGRPLWVDEYTFDEVKPRILTHLALLRSSAEKIGVEILNLNPSPTFDTLKKGTL